jgi:enoyl-CoA hydratase/carnithine racemase
MEYILNSPDGGILKIELNRPQKRNAFTYGLSVRSKRSTVSKFKI